jgi:hypothetical protein
MSCRGVGEPVFPELSWPNRDDAARVSVPLQYIERAELQRSIEQDLDIIDEQKPIAGKVISKVL